MESVKPATIEVDVHHITRVEGHGNIVVDVKSGRIEQCKLEIIEAPRLFEAMLRGQPYAQAAHLSARICGICSVSHSTASLRATEKALGVQSSEQTNLLRRLNILGEMLDSHILHVYMLVAPDLLGVESVVPLVNSAPEVVRRALRMKQVAGDICATIGGRHTHPIAMTVGGFTHFPSNEELDKLIERLEKMRADVDATLELFMNLELPVFERDTEYIALQSEDSYAFMDGSIASSDGGTWALEDYKQATNEFLITHSTAKHARNRREAYMVGALARFNLNYENLHPQAKLAARNLGLNPKNINPYMNSIAQVVEIVHCVEEAILISNQLVERGIEDEDPAPPSRLSGDGVGAVEAPRGTLYHHYEIKNGFITAANCVIPTAQNLANIEADMRALVPKIIHQTPTQITLALEMLVRAYDPCISCSTHILEVEFV
jgi:coenzyme F420-reducing hydrogenase alpha subunit